jgi:hypothetical protein
MIISEYIERNDFQDVSADAHWLLPYLRSQWLFFRATQRKRKYHQPFESTNLDNDFIEIIIRNVNVIISDSQMWFILWTWSIKWSEWWSFQKIWSRVVTSAPNRINASQNSILPWWAAACIGGPPILIHDNFEYISHDPIIIYINIGIINDSQLWFILWVWPIHTYNIPCSHNAPNQINALHTLTLPYSAAACKGVHLF